MDRQKETIIVTGSSGFIGYAVAKRLDRDFDVVGFDREGPPYPPPAAECVCVDLTSEESLQRGLEAVRVRHGERLASVIHLAAYYDFSGEPSPLYEKLTVRGTERLLRGLQSFHVEQFVFSSTMLVHAPTEPGQRINEEWPLEPKWAYPESKVKTEQLIQAQRGDIPAVLLRISGVYDDVCHSIPLAHQIQRIYERRPTSHVFPGDSSHGQAFLHLDDLVDAFVRLVHRRAQLPPELTLLVGEPETLSYDELQRAFGLLIHGEEWETYQIPEPLAEAGAWVQDVMPLSEEPFIKPWMIDLADDHYELDITRARTLLGWEPKRLLRGTLPRMVAALTADPLGWYRENNLEPPSWLQETATQPSVSPVNTEAHQHPRATQPPVPDTTRREPGDGMAARDEMMPTPGDERREPGALMAEHHTMARWVHPVLMILGAWLIASPVTLGYRSPALAWSDIISGVLVVALAALSLAPHRVWASWANAFVGLWLVFAPLVFWAPTAAAYLNDTLVGALVIAFSILIPHGMPMPGPDVPPGWSYNPSSWMQRAPVIALGLVGFFISRYLAAYQLGQISTVWDPFFANGTVRILESEVSRAWPVSDAGLGATVYLLEALMGLMGDPRRWRTMPWMVTFFGILVVPLGVTSIVLVILQPLAVGTWCTLCLIAALAMLIMIPLTLDEVIAMGQFLAQSHREGKPFWRTFWLGGNAPDATEDQRSPDVNAPPSEVVPAMTWGVTLPWNLLLSALLGVWIMAAPAVFGSRDAAADSDHLVGALVVTFAMIALAEVSRAVRFVNIPLGAWIIAAPWLLGGATLGATWNDVLIGAILIVLSLPRGKVREQYGGWNRYIV